eukprot:179402_1
MKPQLKQPQTSDDDKYNEDTQTTKKQQQQPYKIYLLSPYKASQTFVCLSDISDEYFEMRLVTEKNKHLWHLSLALPPSLPTIIGHIQWKKNTKNHISAIHPT